MGDVYLCDAARTPHGKAKADGGPASLSQQELVKQQADALAGDIEMMSRVRFMSDRADYYADANLPPRARYKPTVLAADRLESAEGLSRPELDAVAATSQAHSMVNASSTKHTMAHALPLCDGTGRALVGSEGLIAIPRASLLLPKVVVIRRLH